jgi:hypothetical protein
MKKFTAIFALICIAATMLLTSCNQGIIDMTYKYDKAIIQLANGEVVEVEIAKWYDYDGEQLQIVGKDGTVYLTSSYRCDLIKEDK